MLDVDLTDGKAVTILAICILIGVLCAEAFFCANRRQAEYERIEEERHAAGPLEEGILRRL